MTIPDYIPSPRYDISACGIASLVLGVLTLAWQGAAVLWMYSIHPGGDGAGHGLAAGAILLGGLAYLAGAVPAFAGIILGVLGFRRRFRYRGITIAGLAINLILFTLAMIALFRVALPLLRSLRSDF